MLGFSPYSAASFSDVGSGEQLFVATGVVGTSGVGSVAVTGTQSGLTLGSVQGSAVVNDVSVDAGATATFSVTDQLNGNVSPVIAFTDLSIVVTGVAATGAVGSASTTANATFSVTSPQMSAGVGSATTTALTLRFLLQVLELLVKLALLQLSLTLRSSRYKCWSYRASWYSRCRSRCRR